MFVKYKDGTVLEYPILDIRSRFPNISLPEDLTNSLPEDYYIVRDTSVPEYNHITQKLLEQDPEFKLGKFYRKYQVVDLTGSALSSSIENVKARLTARVSTNLNNFAAARGYDSIESLVSYNNSTNLTFKAEAEQGILVRDAAWDNLLSIFNNLDAGNIPITSIEQLEMLIPDLVWPTQPQ